MKKTTRVRSKRAARRPRFYVDYIGDGLYAVRDRRYPHPADRTVGSIVGCHASWAAANAAARCAGGAR